MKQILKLTAISAALVAGSASAAEEQIITIGTGGQTGVYYVVGQSICKLVNRGNSEHGIKCNAPSTGGSVANVNAITAGEMEMGVAQSDVQYQAYNGTGKFEGKKDDNIRALFSVHPEPFTVVARQDADIAIFTDIKGKRVNVGNPGSGTRETTEVAMKATGVSETDLALKSELKPAEMAAALCDNNLDAITYTVGHPSGAIKEASSSCESVLIPVTGEGVDKVIADNPYYAKVVIPGGMYTGTDNDVETFGVYATFVTSANVKEEVVYQTVKAVFDNFERFKKLHPAFENLKEEDMVKNALSAPLHDGAKKYYKERGWISE